MGNTRLEQLAERFGEGKLLEWMRAGAAEEEKNIQVAAELQLRNIRNFFLATEPQNPPQPRHELRHPKSRYEPKKRRHLSAEARKRISETQKKRWAKWRRANHRPKR